jgi:NAD(P)-dependent dehydrogenase (short-subunit alcohol dehydrogenase family)
MMSQFKPTRAVVTGAGSGLGREFCLELARRGARVMASDVKLEDARATAEACGNDSHAVRCDVSDPAQVEALAQIAEQKLGPIDLVINNAGVAVGGAVGEISLEDWRWIVGVNFWGVIHGCHAFLPRMKARGAGHVLNVASAAGLIYAPLLAPYNMTKAAVVALSETLAAELGGTGVGVTVLCPTFFQTNIAKSSRTTGSVTGMLAETEKMMRFNKIQADGVARFALDACEAGELHALPHADGRWLWRLKRAIPSKFPILAAKALKARAKKNGAP